MLRQCRSGSAVTFARVVAEPGPQSLHLPFGQPGEMVPQGAGHPRRALLGDEPRLDEPLARTQRVDIGVGEHPRVVIGDREPERPPDLCRALRCHPGTLGNVPSRPETAAVEQHLLDGLVQFVASCRTGHRLPPRPRHAHVVCTISTSRPAFLAMSAGTEPRSRPASERRPRFPTTIRSAAYS